MNTRSGKAQISNSRYLKTIKSNIDHKDVIECATCGAIKIEARKLASVLVNIQHSLYNKDGDGKFEDILSTFISELIEYAKEPDESCSDEEYIKWLEELEQKEYIFIDSDQPMVGKYDEVILYTDSTCICFNKDTVEYKISI